jgi:hypothetical protein
MLSVSLFRVEFASREGVRPYGATIPRGYHFALDDKFIDFLLTKRTSTSSLVDH